jgi:peptidoglycan/LPS O-acetylase OafA/YrhL
MAGSPTTAPRATTRPEIQALRAVAIGCVVAYHFWPAMLPAGFVGVDVFFVVSGFLITGLLLRDVERAGRIRLGEFYARRARRILPAAIVVLSASALATLLVVPRIDWRPFLQQILSSTLYVQNWHLARDPQIPGERLRRTRALAMWVGLAAIAVAARTFTDAELFPGWIALLPVLGTAAVIWAGMPRAALSLAPVAALRPVQWFGDISYSLYLWHWPIIMFTPYLTGQPSQAPVMALLLVLSIAVADASKRWIEDPFRRLGSAAPAHPLRRRRRLGLASGAAVVVIALLSSGAVGYAVEKPRAHVCEGSHSGE